MVILLWAGIHALLGSIWLLLESALGLHEQYYTVADIVVLVAIPALCAIGAAVHERLRTQGTFPFGLALRTALGTLALGTVVMAGLWILLTLQVIPGFTDMIGERARMQSEALGHPPQQVILNMAVALQLYTFPGVLFFTLVVPLLSGSVASIVACLGIRRR
ncbi:MAG: DUF4199 family protein [Candidatus Kapabacteria bacterium]|nr:DUF4199 family protein [Candidatus Kapabacteria bacterium]